MPLELIHSVQALIRQVEERTGKPVSVMETRDLPMSAEIRVAAKGETAHHLLYRGRHDEQINYVIANQCGHILRLFKAPAEQRFMPVASYRAMMSYAMEMGDECHRFARLFDPEKIRRMARLWYEGVVFQLTRMPPDIMIDKWLYDAFPDLRPIQLKALSRQRQAAVQSLAGDTRKFTPEKIYRVSNIMNFAFFKVLEDHFRLDWVAPYHGTIFIFDGSALAALTEREYDDSHAGDRAMIDAWAKRLDLTTWFEWRKFEA